MMNYYKSQSGDVFAYDDEQVAGGFVAAGLVEMTPEEIDAHLNQSLPTAPIPTVVTMRQARLALLEVGKLDDIEAMVAMLDRSVQIEWEYAQTVERAHPIVASLGMTDDELDGLFVLAGGK